jgi:hypothetical protein
MTFIFLFLSIWRKLCNCWGVFPGLIGSSVTASPHNVENIKQYRRKATFSLPQADSIVNSSLLLYSVESTSPLLFRVMVIFCRYDSSLHQSSLVNNFG